MATTNTVVTITAGDPAPVRVDTFGDTDNVGGHSLQVYVVSGTAQWGGSTVTPTGATAGIPIAVGASQSWDLSNTDGVWFAVPASGSVVLRVGQIGV